MVLSRLFGGNRTATPSGVVGFTSYATVYDGDAAYDTPAEVAAILEANTATGVFAKVWEKTVPAQQLIRWGSGNAMLQRNQGYMYFAALDAGTGFEDGILRLVQTNARETRTLVVLELNTIRLHTATATSATTAAPTDIDQMLPLPEQVQFPLVGEDSKLQLWFKTTVPTTTVDVVTFSIPITVYQ